MSLGKTLGRCLEAIGIKHYVNEIRFSITRPDWWLESKATYRFYGQFFRPGELCFDVGANDGTISRMFCELGARVVAIEPQPACLPLLHEKLSGIKNAVIVEKAVGSRQGTLDMMLADTSHIASMSVKWIENVKRTNRFPGHDWKRKVTVQVTTLDALIEEHGVPAFCKIDVEGFELEVLKGLSHAPRVVMFEYTPEHEGAVTQCVRRLGEIGKYSFNIDVEQKSRLLWESWVQPEEALNRLEGTADPVLLKGGNVYASL